MSVNGVTSSQAAAAYSYSATESVKADTKAAETAASKETSKSEETSADKGVVYEQSGAKDNVGKTTYKPDTNLINKMKADADARTAQLRSLVEKMMTGQATAYGKANDIWSFLRSGNYTVDPATKAQAQADIAEDGYWGVNQTSDRIIDFAKALTGGDPDKIEDMRAAFEKGFKKAGKTWGGDLPDISQRTYDAVMEKFDQMAEEAKKTSSTPVDTEG
ncbi:hypothetical protein [uncultured Acetatifactor sp.]|jgi:hypothetical protein|uniref:hypothetical protein n=1 Tax=uncultured Acetatifactor sp. TaxID=1671927 RepID=UPI0025E0125A|nr:hypothetical protein [uncultured Acetatifactor sp.]